MNPPYPAVHFKKKTRLRKVARTYCTYPKEQIPDFAIDVVNRIGIAHRSLVGIFARGFHLGHRKALGQLVGGHAKEKVMSDCLFSIREVETLVRLASKMGRG